MLSVFRCRPDMDIVPPHQPPVRRSPRPPFAAPFHPRPPSLYPICARPPGKFRVSPCLLIELIILSAVAMYRFFDLAPRRALFSPSPTWIYTSNFEPEFWNNFWLFASIVVAGRYAIHSASWSYIREWPLYEIKLTGQIFLVWIFERFFFVFFLWQWQNVCLSSHYRRSKIFERS